MNKSCDGVKLVKAAIWVDSLVYTGWRHADIMWYLKEHNLVKHVSQDMQGFVDQYGNYYRRKAAGMVAFRNNQITEYVDPLTSEHLWDIDGNPI
jgi:hypothetical protein